MTLRNARYQTRRSVLVTPANVSEWKRAMFFVRLGALDVCTSAPFHPEYDRWIQKDQLNYEHGRRDTLNFFATLRPEQQAEARSMFIRLWPEDFDGVPPVLSKAIGAAINSTGNSAPGPALPPDNDVDAHVLRDARGRMRFKIPTVCEN